MLWCQHRAELHHPQLSSVLNVLQFCIGLISLVAAEAKEDGSKDDKQKRLTPGLEALLGVAEAHSKDNGNTATKAEVDAGTSSFQYIALMWPCHYHR